MVAAANVVRQGIERGAQLAGWLNKTFARFAGPAKVAATVLSVLGMLAAGFVAFLVPIGVLMLFG